MQNPVSSIDNINNLPALNEEQEDMVWIDEQLADSSEEQGQEEEVAAEDERHDNLQFIWAWDH